MKKLLHILILILALSIRLTYGESRVSPNNSTEFDTVHLARSLQEILEEIGREYGVFVSYESSIAQNVEVDFEINPEENLESAISRLLEDLNLSYEILQDKHVLIYKNDKYNHETARKIRKKIRQLDKLQKRSSVQLIPQYSNKKEQLISVVRYAAGAPYNIDVTGTVTDDQGEPLIGVNIRVKGTDQGTASDFDGNFSLENIDENAILIVSYIGYQTQEVNVDGNSNITIVMISDSQLLDEVVVVGYGTKKKVSLTGSIASTSNKELTPAPVIGVSNALSGLLPGVIVSNRSGQPGQTSSILIRGRSTTGNNNPLVVVDGIPGYSGWSYLNPEDIESISVLKDASAAIYGARAANGVILITTKRGTVGKPTFEYSLNEGLSTLTRIPDMADSELYAQFANEYRARFNQTPLYTEDQIAKFKAGTDPLFPNIDWYRETLKKYTSQRQHRLAMTGGTELLNYLVAASYSSQNGIFKSGNSNFSTYSVMARLDSKINDYLNIGFDLNTALDDNFDTGNPFSDLGRSLPTTPVFWPNGMPSSGVTAGANPYIQASEISGYNSDISKRYSTKLSFKLQFPWVKSLSSDGFFVYTNNSVFSKDWSKPYITNSYSYGTQEYSVVNGGPQTPVLSEAATNASSNLIHFKLNYNEEFFNHGISAFVAFEQFTSKSNNFSAGRRDFYSDILDQIFAGGLSNQTTGGSASNSSRQNVFGRLSYNYSEKYLVDFNIRYDGSSNFPSGNRWGFFPGASVAWRVSEENFMKDLTNLDNVKIRLSYGRIGNDQVPSFQWLSTYSITSRGYAFGGTESTLLGLTQGVNPNPYITWEVANMANLGFDLNLWNGRLDATFELFKQRRSNILAKRDLVIPGTAGLRLPDENIGVVDNKGFELNLGTRMESDGGILYHLGVNMAFARNKIIDVDEAANIPEWQKREGNIIGAPLLYEAVSIIRTEAQLESVPVYPGTIVGHLQYRDTDNNGIISEADMVRINQSSTPEITFGLNFSGLYKNFEVWANVTGQSRAWVQFHKHSKGAGHNSLKELLENRYTPGSMDSKYPIIPDSETRNQDIDGFPSTFWHKDASFIRLKTLQLSYRIPEFVYQKVGLKSARVYLSGSNLLTIDGLKWYDPEGDRLIGDFYPQSKVFNLGLNIKL